MKINQLKAGVIISYITTILGALISIAYTPAMLRLLGQGEYGLYTLAGSVVSYLNLLNFGLSASYVRYYSIYKKQSDEKGIANLNGMFMIIFCTLGLIALVAGLILAASSNIMFANSLSKEEIKITTVLIAILSFNIFLAFPATVYNSYITANEKFFVHRILSLIKTVASPMLTLLVLLMGFRSIGMVVVTVVVHLAVDIINFIYALKKLKMKFLFNNFDKALFKDITTFSSFIFINIIVDQINWNVSKFLLGIYHGSVATAIYGIAAQLNTYYQQISTTISAVFIPRVHKLVNNKDQKGINCLFNKVGRIQFIILMLICIGFVLFGKQFIIFWAGEEYNQAYPIALLMFIPSIAPLIQNLGIEIQRALYLHKFRSYLYITMAMLNLAISIPLCKAIGGIGAVMGTALSLIFGNGVIMNIYYKKKCNIDILGFWKEIIKIMPSFIIPVILGIGIVNALNIGRVLEFILGIVLFLIIYFVSVWFLGMNNYEKSLILNPIKKFFRK